MRDFAPDFVARVDGAWLQDDYTHLRALASGAVPGFSVERQAVAQKSMERFISDSAKVSVTHVAEL